MGRKEIPETGTVTDGMALVLADPPPHEQPRIETLA